LPEARSGRSLFSTHVEAYLVSLDAVGSGIDDTKATFADDLVPFAIENRPHYRYFILEVGQVLSDLSMELLDIPIGPPSVEN
jgi:hypothetical protein